MSAKDINSKPWIQSEVDIYLNSKKEYHNKHLALIHRVDHIIEVIFRHFGYLKPSWLFDSELAYRFEPTRDEIDTDILAGKYKIEYKVSDTWKDFGNMSGKDCSYNWCFPYDFLFATDEEIIAYVIKDVKDYWEDVERERKKNAENQELRQKKLKAFAKLTDEDKELLGIKGLII